MRQRQPLVCSRVAIGVDRLLAAADEFDLLLEQSPVFEHTDIGGTEQFQRAVHDWTLRGHEHDILRNDVVADPIAVRVTGRYLEPRHLVLLRHADPMWKAVGAMTKIERVRIVDRDLVGADAGPTRVDGRYVGEHFRVTDVVGVGVFLIPFQYDAPQQAVGNSLVLELLMVAHHRLDVDLVSRISRITLLVQGVLEEMTVQPLGVRGVVAVLYALQPFVRGDDEARLADQLIVDQVLLSPHPSRRLRPMYSLFHSTQHYYQAAYRLNITLKI